MEGAGCPGDDPGSSCSSPVALSHICPIPLSRSRPWDLLQALEQKLRWAKGKTQGQKAGDKASVPHSSASLHPCSWAQESLSGIQVLLQSGVIVPPKCQCTSPSLIWFNRIKTRKTEGKAPEAGRTYIVGGFISTVLLFFPLWRICTVAWET